MKTNKRKRVLAMFLCVLMLVSTLSLTANAALQLPDGGQLTNSDEPAVWGYTKGGSVRQVRMDCSVSMWNYWFYFRASATTKCSVPIGTDAYTTVALVQLGENFFAKKYGGSPAATEYSFTLTVDSEDGSIVPVRASAGQSYNSTAYGSWICGTTTFVFDL